MERGAVLYGADPPRFAARHEKGIIHRDIKPQNIMLLEDGTIKVTDFGIARFSQAETQTMTDKAIGSVHYIAPGAGRAAGYINE